MVLEHAWKTYTENIRMLIVFSVSFLIGLAIPIIANAPTYNAFGGVFLRYMSMPEMSVLDVLTITLAFLLSTFFVSFGIVAANLIVKRERTMVNLASEVVNNITRSTFIVFMVFVFLFIVNAAVQLLLTELRAPYWLNALVFFIVYLPSFYIGPAIVIDELKPVHAIMASVDHIKRYPIRVAKWAAIGIAMLALTSLAAYLILPSMFQWVTLLVNSFLIIPFLIVYQAHSYIEKYRLVKR